MKEHVMIAPSSSAPPSAQGKTWCRAFGLTIASDIPLPELAACAPGVADLAIEYAGFDLPDEALEGDEPELQVGPDETVMSFRGVARFWVRAADRVVRYAPTTVGADLVRLPLLGPVMATFLSLQRRLVLHSSAVDRGAGAVIFLGDKGAGKSTTAAAFVRGGYDLLTDDVLSCRRDEAGRFTCDRSYPQLKLTPQTAASVVLDNVQALPSPHPLFGKQQQRLLGPTGADSIAPSLVLLLERGPQIGFHRLSGAEALMGIMRFAYILRYGAAFLQGEAGIAHFAQCTQFANTVPVARFIVPENLDALDQLIGAVETYQEALVSS